MKELQPITSYIKHLAVSGLSGVSARIKSTCNLTERCFEMPNVSYTQPLKASQSKTINRNLICKMCFYFFANARGKLLGQRTNGTFGFANT